MVRLTVIIGQDGATVIAQQSEIMNANTNLARILLETDKAKRPRPPAPLMLHTPSATSPARNSVLVLHDNTYDKRGTPPQDSQDP